MNWRIADLARRRAPILTRLMDTREISAWLKAMDEGYCEWGDPPWRWWKYAELGVEGGPFHIELVVSQRPSEFINDAGELYRMRATVLDVLPLIQNLDELYILVRKIGVTKEVRYPAWGPELTSPSMQNVWSWDERRVMVGQTSKASPGEINFSLASRWTAELPHFDKQIKLWDMMFLDGLRQAGKHHSAYVLDTVLDLHPNGIEPYKE